MADRPYQHRTDEEIEATKRLAEHALESCFDEALRHFAAVKAMEAEILFRTIDKHAGLE